MKSEYTVNEVIEIGEAQEVILGQQKVGGSSDETQPIREFLPDSDLDD
jgi:hypothetical protein